MDYPIYRKYTNNKSWFKVLDASTFEEVQRMGSYYSIQQYKAKILPDRNFIADMIALKDGSWVEVNAAEYEAFVMQCSKEFKKMT